MIVFGASVSATPSIQSSDAIRNYIARQWTYSSRGNLEQNCLSYALGMSSSVWYWPWDAYPSRGDAKNLLYSYGYHNQADAGNLVPFPGIREIYAYYNDGGITHFSVAIGSPANTMAKWGKNEIFAHNNENPYTDNVYGHMTFKANLSD